MLKGIPKILSPELLKVMCEMGHGDRIVIADGNFPSESVGKDAKVIRMDGHGACEVLEAVLELFPLDTYVEKPVNLMEVVPGDKVDTPIWGEYEKPRSISDNRGESIVSSILSPSLKSTYVIWLLSIDTMPSACVAYSSTLRSETFASSCADKRVFSLCASASAFV